jgi:hypothetical protein
MLTKLTLKKVRLPSSVHLSSDLKEKLQFKVNLLACNKRSLSLWEHDHCDTKRFAGVFEVFSKNMKGTESERFKSLSSLFLLLSQGSELTAEINALKEMAQKDFMSALDALTSFGQEEETKEGERSNTPRDTHLKRLL